MASLSHAVETARHQPGGWQMGTNNLGAAELLHCSQVARCKRSHALENLWEILQDWGYGYGGSIYPVYGITDQTKTGGTNHALGMNYI